MIQKELFDIKMFVVKLQILIVKKFFRRGDNWRGMS